MKAEIIPAVMPENFVDLTSHVSLVRHDVQTVQLDLMDGVYTPPYTWPFSNDGDRDLSNMVNEQQGMPFWEDVNYELDLMVAHPEQSIETWLSLGPSRIIFHLASVSDWNPIREIDSVMRNFLELGIAVTIHDDPESLYHLIDEKIVDFVQVMGIGQVGYQGQVFEPSSLNLIQKIKQVYPDITVSVDGGVSDETIGLFYEAGADRFVSGSYVFHNGSTQERIENLYRIIEG